MQSAIDTALLKHCMMWTQNSLQVCVYYDAMWTTLILDRIFIDLIKLGMYSAKCTI